VRSCGCPGVVRAQARSLFWPVRSDEARAYLTRRASPGIGDSVMCFVQAGSVLFVLMEGGLEACVLSPANLHTHLAEGATVR
jgi:hypothetical protein